MKILHVEPLRYQGEVRTAAEKLGDVQWEDCADQESFLAALRDSSCEGLFVRLGLAVDRAALDAAPSLRFVATPTTGVDHLDTAELERRRIALIALRGETTFLESIGSTAEHTFALLLALARRLPAAHSDVCAGHWRREPFLGFELSGKTLGLIGCGRLGRMVARMALGFGMAVLAHDRDPAALARAPAGALAASAEEALAADVVSLHLPLDGGTRGWLSAERVAALRPRALLVNTARGELCDEAALLAALESGALAGAALDVLAGDSSWDGEVPAEHPLVRYAQHHPNLILTPHIGGYGRDSLARTRGFLVERVREHLARSSS